MIEPLQAMFSQAQLLTMHKFTWWFHMFVAFTFIAYLPYSKLFHIFLGPINQFLRKREPMGEGIPEVQVAIDREKASKYGLTAYQIANGLKGTLSGTTATRYRYEGKEINVVITGDDTFKQSLSNLEQTPITTPLGTDVPLSQIAEVTIERGPTAIERSGQARVVHGVRQKEGPYSGGNPRIGRCGGCRRNLWTECLEGLYE